MLSNIHHQAFIHEDFYKLLIWQNTMKSTHLWSLFSFYNYRYNYKHNMGNYSRGERIVLCLEPLSSMLKSCSSRYEVVNLQSKWSAPYGAKELHVPAGNKVNEPEFKSNSNFRKNVEGRSTTVQKILNSTEGIKFTSTLFCQTECKKKEKHRRHYNASIHPSGHISVL